jgi:hypothetical protein
MLHRVPLAALLALVLGGCSAESTDSSGGGPCVGSATAVDTYVAGLTVEGQAAAMRFELVDALPAPPGRGTNRWVVRLRDGDGAPLDGATVTKVKAWMPDHGHGSGVAAKMTHADDGTSTIDGLELVMPGVWTVTVSGERDGTTDEGSFAFCIDG